MWSKEAKWRGGPCPPLSQGFRKGDRVSISPILREGGWGIRLVGRKLFLKLSVAGMAPFSLKSGRMPRGRCCIKRLEAFPLSFPHKGRLKFTGGADYKFRSDQGLSLPSWKYPGAQDTSEMMPEQGCSSIKPGTHPRQHRGQLLATAIGGCLFWVIWDSHLGIHA